MGGTCRQSEGSPEENQAHKSDSKTIEMPDWTSKLGLSGVHCRERHEAARAGYGRKNAGHTETTTKSEVRSLLGLIGFYREFVPNFTAITGPLSDLVKKGRLNKTMDCGVGVHGCVDV